MFSIKIFNFYKFFSKTWSGLLIKNFVHQNALQPMTSYIERGPLQIIILLVTSLPLALKLCADPFSMNFVFFACDWSLFTAYQSITLTKSEFNLSIRSSVS